MIRSRFYLALAARIAVAITAWLGAAVAADAPAAEGDERPLRFRRVLVPEDHVDEVLSGVRNYLSIERETFGRLIKRSDPARIVAAKYHARLDGETLLVGTAQLEVECPQGQQAGLLLDGCGLPIDHPRWQTDGHEKQALVGIDARGRLVVTVDRSARLTFSWSLRGTKDAAGVVRFPIRLPSSASSHFLCEIPQGKTLQVSEGVLEVGTGGRPTQKSKSKDGPAYRTWPIRLGSQNRFSLAVVPEDVIRQHQRLTLVRQHSVYEISARGVVLTTTLNLDIHNESLRQVTLLLDPPPGQPVKTQPGVPAPSRQAAPSLQLVRAMYGGSDVPWTVESRPGKATRVRLQFPETIQGADRVLTLQATCPLPDRLRRRWRLPRIRSEKTFWQEGTAQVIVAAGLSLEGASAVPGRQTPSLSEDSVSFEFFSPDASLDVVVGRGQSPIEARIGSAVEIGPDRVVCRWKAQLSCRHGSHFKLSADVPTNWIVDSVGPPEVIRRWQRDRATGKLVLEFDRAVTPQQPLGIAIVGHRVSSSAALGVEDFRLVTIVEAIERRRLMTIKAAPSYQLETAGAEELKRLDPESLGADAGLFDELPRRLLFEVGEGAERLRVSWTIQSPRFSARLSVDASLRGNLLKETYHIRCVPSDSQVAKFRVRLSHARNTPLRWSLVGGDARALHAVSLSQAAPGIRRLTLRGETWELTLAKATAQPFEIVATRSTSLQEIVSANGAAPLALASLPMASSQQGTVTIHSNDPIRLRVHHERLKAIPVAPADARYQTIRAKFSYEPRRETPAAATAIAVEVSSAVDQNRQPLAWVWSSIHQSRISPQGDVEHLATFHMQNTGRKQIVLTLPEASTKHTIWVNRQQQTPRADGNRLTIDLPEGEAEKFPTVTLHYTTSGRRLAVSQRLLVDLVKLEDIPQMNRRWKVWVPPGYEVTSSAPQRLGDTAREVTWSQRLFGPLGRKAQSTAFDPLDSEAWAQLVRNPEQQAAARLRTDQLLQALGAPPAGEQSWGDLLTFAESAPRESQPPLLIDWRSLREMELLPTTIVPPRPLASEPSHAITRTTGSSSPSETEDQVHRASMGMRTLMAANLVLFVQPDAIVLTTRSIAARHRQTVIAIEAECVYWIPPGRLRNQWQRAARSGETVQDDSGSSLVDLATWKTVPATGVLPWDSLERFEGITADHLGWTAYDFDLSGGDSPPALRVVHHTSMMILGYAITMMVIVAWWWIARVLEKRGRVLMWLAANLSGIALPCMALGLFGAIAMLAPAGLTPLTSGLFLGTLVAILLRPLAKHIHMPLSEPRAESTVSLARPAAIALGLSVALLIGVLMKAATAQQPADSPAGKTVPSPRVFLPVDAQQRPVGNVWLPRQFYDALRRRESRQTGQPRQWLLRSARYRGKLAWKRGEPSQLESLRVEIDLWTFAADTTVKVAIPRNLVDQTAASARLDTEAVVLRWDAAGDVATFRVKQAGRHLLSVWLRPRVEHDPATDVSQFDVAIPALPTSVIELDTPSQISSIEAPSALGRTRHDKNRFSAVLGATDRLQVRWSSRPQRDPTPPQFNIEQLTWLTVRPNSVMVEAKFHVKVISGRLRQLEIDVDERLRLLPSSGSQWPVRNVTFHKGPRSSMRLELDRPVQDSVDIYMKFLMTGTSGVGELRQPTLEAVGARSTRRWLAVSVDPGLKHTPGTIAAAIRKIAPDDFLGKWGDQETTPQLAYQIPQGDVSWSLKTSPQAPRTTADEVLLVSLRRRQARLRFSASLSTENGAQYQYRVRIPSRMTIDRVLVEQAGVIRRSRWTNDGRGGLMVFLIGPVSGPQRLTVEGDVKLARPVNWKSIAINMDRGAPADGTTRVQVSNRRIGIFRRPSVLVRIDRAGGLRQLKEETAQTPPLPEVEQDLGRLVAWFEKKPGLENLQLSLRPNQPEVIASQLTTLVQHQDVWSVRLDFQIEKIAADSGVLDVLRFDIPAHWDNLDGSLEVSPPAAISLEKIPGETSQQLVVRPAQAIDGPLRISVTGLTLAKGQRVALPDIVPLGLGNPRRFVMLPKTIAGQPFQWEPQDLSEISIDEISIDGVPLVGRRENAPQSTFTSYEVTDHGRPQAIRRSVQQTFEAPLIRLMDVTVAWQTDGSCQGTVLYDLEPAGMTDVQLAMPTGYRFVAARVAGLEAGAHSENGASWRIPLASAQLPQRIEVTFTGQMTSKNKHKPDLEAPRLVGIGVERTLWTVYGPPAVGAVQPQETMQQSTALAHAQSRLRSLANLIEEEAPVAAISSAEHLAAWYRPWAERLIAARREFRRQQLTAAQGQIAGANANADADADFDFDRRQAQISPQIQTILHELSLLHELSRQPVSARDPNQLWHPDYDENRIATRFAFIGETHALSLQYAPTPQGDLTGRIAVALLMLIFSAAVVWGLRRGLSIPSPVRWAHALAVAIGIAWWLWLSPSPLGALIVLVAAVSAIWPLRIHTKWRPWALWSAR